MNRCPIAGCDGPVLKDKLMCLKHWRQVPRQVQLDVYRCWATLLKCKKQSLVRTAARAYREARERALRAFEERAA